MKRVTIEVTGHCPGWGNVAFPSKPHKEDHVTLRLVDYSGLPHPFEDYSVERVISALASVLPPGDWE